MTVFLVLAVISWLCLFQPRRIQEWMQGWVLQHPNQYIWGGDRGKDFLNSPGYLWYLRLVGLGAGYVALLMLYYFLRFLDVL